jgi:uncharacterized protein YndB with AHSA1/START domain
MTSSYTYSYSMETDAAPEAVWALYEDASTWPDWDAQAELVTRDGPFAAGTTGTMKFVDQDPLEYRLTKVEPRREFVDETPVDSLVVRVSHMLEPLPSGRLRVTYTAQIDGPKGEAQQVGPMITADFPDTMTSLVALAKERSS